MNLADGLKQLSRMCAKCHEKCDECRLNNKDFCSLEPADRDDEINERAAAIIEKWAEENPEPVYPTWREWLIKLGIVSFETDFRALVDTRPTTLANAVKAYINEEGSKPIPADIAQKLGIKPKEG